ncbi:MAG: hypothetical protein IT423_05045 [Pirellulaceae bacterium]|nr:hypothetical protein [Pirellulaceae bacterium]
MYQLIRPLLVGCCCVAMLMWSSGALELPGGVYHSAGLHGVQAADNGPKEATAVFALRIVDQQTGRGVPLVELETIHHVRLVTDSDGVVAIREPDLLGRNVFFTIRSHGYRFPKDGFGMEGKAIKVEPGQSLTLPIERINLAERLYRTTGSGIYQDSMLAGRMPEDSLTALPGDVIGCDSVMTAIYQNKMFWFWGDTNRPHYPIGGNFHITAATTSLDSKQWSAERPPAFEYIVGPDKAIRPVAQMTGDGPTWTSAMTVLPGKAESPEMLVAGFIKVRNQLEAYRWGFARWDDAQASFVEIASFTEKPRMFYGPQTHTFLHTDQGVRYVYFATPLPLTRVRASLDAFIDPNQYQGFTCLKAGTTVTDQQLDRDASGKLRYAWKTNTPALTQKEQSELIAAGRMRPEEAWVQLRDYDSGKEVVAHSGSVYWNAYRQRWVLITVQFGGESSLLGEVWYAEADQPTGPWCYARKVVTHNQYSFYNPKHHPEFDAQGGRQIFFEGTYTSSFSGNPLPTARYDYNQIMYRLDLTSDQLNLPVAYYNADPNGERPDTHSRYFSTGGSLRSSPQDSPQDSSRASQHKAEFFAWDRPYAGSVAVVQRDGKLQVERAPVDPKSVQFYAWPPTPAAPNEQTVPLYEYINAVTRSRRYVAESDWSSADYRRSAEPVCWVWKSAATRGP